MMSWYFNISPSARDIFGIIFVAQVELYYALGIPIDKTKMHDGHSRSVAQVIYTQCYISIYNTIINVQNLKPGSSFEVKNECVVLLNWIA